MTAHLPFGNWNLLLCLGSHRVQLPSKEGAHFLCHRHVQKLQAKDVPVAEEVSALFAGELNPVAPKAQKKVPVPEG